MSWRASRASEILRNLCYDSPYSAAERLGILRGAALLADAEGDFKTACEARRHLITMHLRTSAELDLIAAFAWLLHSDSGDSYRSLWTYKWVVEVMPQLVSITADQIEQTLNDLEHRYALAGLSSAAAAQLRVTLAITMKQRDRLPEAFEAWQRNESGAGSDCAACRRHKRVEYFAALGDDERVSVESTPFLEGTLRCAQIPRETYPAMILPLLRRGLIADADDVFERGRESLSESELVPPGIGEYFIYLAARRRIEEGCALVTTWLRRALLSRNDYVRYNVFRGAASLFRAAGEAGTDVVHLAAPPAWTAFEPDGLYDVRTLAVHFASEAAAIASCFDQRNGNTGFHDELLRDRALLEQLQ